MQQTAQQQAHIQNAAMAQQKQQLLANQLQQNALAAASAQAKAKGQIVAPVVSASSKQMQTLVPKNLSLEQRQSVAQKFALILPQMASVNAAIKALTNLTPDDPRKVKQRLITIKNLIEQQQDAFSRGDYFLDSKSCDDMLISLNKMFQYAQNITKGKFSPIIVEQVFLFLSRKLP